MHVRCICMRVCVHACVWLCARTKSKYTAGVVNSMYIQIWQFETQSLADWQRIAEDISTMPS